MAAAPADFEQLLRERPTEPIVLPLHDAAIYSLSVTLEPSGQALGEAKRYTINTSSKRSTRELKDQQPPVGEPSQGEGHGRALV